MNKKHRGRGAIVAAAMAGVVLSAAWAQAQDPGKSVYMRRDGTAITREPGANSATVVELGPTDRMTVISNDGRVLKVRTDDGREGFVSRLRVTDSAPRRGTGIQLASDMGPSERSDVTSVRGLSPMAEEYVASGAVPESAKVETEKITALAGSISDDEVKAFMREGGIEAQ